MALQPANENSSSLMNGSVATLIRKFQCKKVVENEVTIKYDNSCVDNRNHVVFSRQTKHFKTPNKSISNFKHDSTLNSTVLAIQRTNLYQQRGNMHSQIHEKCLRVDSRLYQPETDMTSTFLRNEQQTRDKTIHGKYVKLSLIHISEPTRPY